jgi:hypothetical protein
MNSDNEMPAELKIVDAAKVLPVDDFFELHLAAQHDAAYDRAGQIYCRDLEVQVVNREDRSSVAELKLNLFFPARYYNPDWKEMVWEWESAAGALIEVCHSRSDSLAAMAACHIDSMIHPTNEGPIAYLEMGQELAMREFGKAALDSLFRWLSAECGLGELYFFAVVPENKAEVEEFKSILYAWERDYLARECEDEESLVCVPFGSLFDGEEEENEEGDWAED